MVAKVAVSAFCLSAVALLAGCDTQGSTSRDQSDGSPANAASGVAVIDLDAVAQKLGRDVQMANSIQQQAGSLNEQLKQYQVTLRGQFEEKKSQCEARPPATEEEQQRQQAELQLYDRQLGSQLIQAKQKAQQHLNSRRLRLIQQFRDEVKPVAQEVAAELGLHVVVTKNDSVVYSFDPHADITDRVVARMRSAIPARPDAPAAETASRPAGSPR